MASTRLIKSLKPFTSCDIGDALVKLKYPFGGFLDGLHALSPLPSPLADLNAASASQPLSAPTKVIGPAVTVEMVEVSNSSAPTPERHFADCNEPLGIMYIKQPKGLYSACWGGLMSTRAKALGAPGVVVDGRVRDVGEHREMGFPVFARSTSILGSNTFTRAARANVPVQFQGDLWIHPGDILFGDVDGVVVVPPSLVEEVVKLCRERAEIDEKMFAGLRKGESFQDLIKAFRK